jgi:hypothetical protein
MKSDEVDARDRRLCEQRESLRRNEVDGDQTKIRYLRPQRHLR